MADSFAAYLDTERVPPSRGGVGAGKRARSDDQKRARSQTILRAAETLFLKNPASLATVSEIAREARVAKGTVYLYFATKEELFLAVLEWRLGRWIDDILAALASDRPALTLDDFCDIYIDYPSKHPIVLTLAGLSPTVLEANVGLDVAIAFKSAQIGWLERLGEALAARINGLDPRMATATFLRSYGYMIGIWQLSNPPEVCRKAFETPGLEALDLDFADEARAGLTALWDGLFNKDQTGGG